MFEIFLKQFSRDAALSIGGDEGSGRFRSDDWTQLVGRFGGFSFESGLYRVILGSEIDGWNARIAHAFPEYGRVRCFGFDWLGRAFAVDPLRFEGGRPGVLMFEPGTGEVLQLPCNLVSFHDEELVEYRDAALASAFHQKWLSLGESAPHYHQCVGYRRPLFLGGSDELGNLEVSDIDVYWHLFGQLIAKAGVTRR